MPPPTPRLSHAAAYEFVPVPAPVAPPQTPPPTEASLAMHDSALTAAQTAPKVKHTNLFRGRREVSRTVAGAYSAGSADAIAFNTATATSRLAPRAHQTRDGAEEAQYSLTGRAGNQLFPLHAHSWMRCYNFCRTDEEMDYLECGVWARFTGPFNGGLDEDVELAPGVSVYEVLH